MLAFESLALLLVVVYLIYKNQFGLIGKISSEPYLVFALVFSLGFAFAVGISTWNFGTLVRYKLPLMPIFGSMLVILYYKTQNTKTTKSEIM